MKKIIFSVILIIASITCMSCGSSSSVEGFSDVIGKDWKLIEVRSDNKDVSFNRNALSKEDAKDIFTMKIDAEIISGKGASNIFSSPYKLGEGQSIEIMPMRSTLMAPLRQPEKLKEHEFLLYLQNSSEWKVVDKKLEFHSKTDEGSTIVLVFSL